MQRGFYLAIAATKASNVEKRIMKTALDNLTVESFAGYIQWKEHHGSYIIS
jgi:hypothetical protein